MAALSIGTLSASSTTSTSSVIALSATPSGGSGTGYSTTLYRSTTSGFTPSSSTQIATNVTFPYTDNGLTAGQTYYYEAVGTDSANDVANTSQLTVSTPASSTSSGGSSTSSGTTSSGGTGSATSGSTASGSNTSSGSAGGSSSTVPNGATVTPTPGPMTIACETIYGVVGEPIQNPTIRVTGNTGVVSIVVGSNMAPGVRYIPGTGFTGKALSPFGGSITITAVDSIGTIVNQDVEMLVKPALNIIDPQKAIIRYTGHDIRYNVRYEGGIGNIQFSIVSVTPPAGVPAPTLTMDEFSSVIRGRVITAGIYTVVVEVTDGISIDEQAFTFNVLSQKMEMQTPTEANPQTTTGSRVAPLIAAFLADRKSQNPGFITSGAEFCSAVKHLCANTTPSAYAAFVNMYTDPTNQNLLQSVQLTQGMASVSRADYRRAMAVAQAFYDIFITGGLAARRVNWPRLLTTSGSPHLLRLLRLASRKVVG